MLVQSIAFYGTLLTVLLTTNPRIAGSIKFDMSKLNASAQTKLTPVKIPLKLPQFLVVKNLTPDERSLFSTVTDNTPNRYQQSLFSTVTVATPNQYRIVIGAKNCPDEDYCALGYLTGKRKDSETPSLAELLKQSKESFENYEDHSPQMPAEVVLKTGGKGAFIPWSCRVYCTASQLVWEDGSIQYSVELKQADREELLATVNSIFKKSIGRYNSTGKPQLW